MNKSIKSPKLSQRLCTRCTSFPNERQAAEQKEITDLLKYFTTLHPVTGLFGGSKKCEIDFLRLRRHPSLVKGSRRCSRGAVGIIYGSGDCLLCPERSKDGRLNISG